MQKVYVQPSRDKRELCTMSPHEVLSDQGTKTLEKGSEWPVPYWPFISKVMRNHS